jgi:hypothetical protein
VNQPTAQVRAPVRARAARNFGLTPVIDGRTEAYAVSYLSDYGRAVTVAAGWEGFVSSTGARWAVLPVGSPLATGLIERQNWQMLGRDAGFILMQAP